jgi:hypothetical protein
MRLAGAVLLLTSRYATGNLVEIVHAAAIDGVVEGTNPCISEVTIAVAVCETTV